MENLARLLRTLNERMNQMDSRLDQIESSKLVLEERKIIAGEKELEGKTYLSRQDGGIIKEVRVGVCDVCGKRCSEFNACTNCGRKLDEACSIVFRNKVYCADCLNQIVPLSKQEYMLLEGIARDVPLKALGNISKIKEDELKACENSLAEKRLIEQKGFLFFQETKILDTGLEALDVYTQVYSNGKQGDVTGFEEELRRFLDGKK